MRTTERMRKLQSWTYEAVCRGRLLKTPASGMDVTKIERQEPKVYVAFFPSRPDETEWAEAAALNTVPSILLMPVQGYAKNMEEQRFDRYSNIHRTKEMGQTLSVQALFSVFEDGVRAPGFIDRARAGDMDLTLLREGTEDGVCTLFNWMDDFTAALLGAKAIPDTDLSVIEASVTYSLYSDQKYVNDKRPLFYGFVNATFSCYANEADNERIRELLQ